ncbi:hypothetical protein ABMA27_004818 [Loxostege sticticalis]|uniref:Insulin-like domain-containing protein n=1 Tax=Loxostege sticticalis TaxID=481309 RepID=A0ABR3HL27_LOXSC
MKSSHLLLLTLLVLTLTMSSEAGPPGYIFCGRRLAQILQIVCGDDYSTDNNEFYTHDVVKRSIYDDCCTKVCTFDVIKLYCN